MNTKSVTALKKLQTNLEDLVKAYRALLGVVRQERSILTSANLDDLNDNNRAKENLIIKIRGLEATRIRYARDLADLEGLEADNPRLMDLAKHFDGAVGESLRNLHSTLDLLLKRVQEINKENEQLVNSALATITGAMENIRESIDPARTYESQGKIEKGARPGHFVSREL